MSKLGVAQIAALAALLLAAPTLGWTQPTAASATPESKVVTQDGHKGLWFPMPAARRLLRDVRLLETSRTTLQRTKDRLELEKDRAVLLTRSIETSDKIAALWKSTAEQQSKALGTQDVWWRSPYLWVTVGFVVGTATTVGIVFAVKESGAAR